MTGKEEMIPSVCTEVWETMVKKISIVSLSSGVLCGKPMDEIYFEEYKKIITEVINDPALPVLANINIGHAAPRCIIPFGVNAVVDADRQLIRFNYEESCSG